MLPTRIIQIAAAGDCEVASIPRFSKHASRQRKWVAMSAAFGEVK